MHRFRLFQFVLAALAAFSAPPAMAQTWAVVEPAGNGASASVCPLGEDGSSEFLCFRVECTSLEPLHFSLDIAGRGDFTEPLNVGVGVDGGDVGLLTFTPRAGKGFTHFTAGYDPRLHEEIIDLLQRGRRANLVLDLPGGAEDVPMGLTFSADSLLTAVRTCPEPVPPVDDPGSLVLDEVAGACRDLGGTVTMEPGFERREDLDGDGREDLVIDYAAAACSEAATLNCGSGGCTVGFFLARDEGYTRMFADVIRGYEVFPGGFLALDLHGSACGLYGFEACRKVFDIAGDAPVLVEEIAGPDAETMTVAGADPVGTDTEPGTEVAVTTAEPVVVAESDGVAIALDTETEETGIAATAESPAADIAMEVTAPDTDAAVETDTTAMAIAVDATEETDVAVTVPTPDAASVAEPVTLALATPGASETLVLADENNAEAVAPEPSPEPNLGPSPEPNLEPAAALAADGVDGPSSRHMAGPAPSLPEGARFRGDGTLIKPDDETE